MLKIYIKTYSLLDATERKQLLVLFLCILFMAILEVLGVASVMPFMAVLASPNIIRSNQFLSFVYASFGFADDKGFMIFLGITVFVVMVVSNCFSAATTWFLAHYGFNVNHSIARRLLTTYLSQPYVFFLNINCAVLSKNIVSEIGRIITGILNTALTALAKLITAVLIFGLLFAVNPFLASIMTVLLGGFYTIVFYKLKRVLKRNGDEYVVASESLFKALAEALGGVKDIKLLGKEQAFIEKFSIPSSRIATYHTVGSVVPLLPKFALELFAFGGVILIIVYYLFSNRGLETILPLITVYVVAGYRLMPALQSVFAGFSQARFYQSSLDTVCNDMALAAPGQDDRLCERLPFSKDLSLKGLAFYYPNRLEPALLDLSLTIGANTTVAFVGESGSGKTTTADIILGLLRHQNGSMAVDGIEIDDENMRAWQKNIGYVPQSIFLCDDTITRNIAFGVPDECIDFTMVQEVALMANLHDFITNELPLGYETIVGERGVRLSGGQRQRIGIARALYHQPSLLVLDEATSALDGITENAVMDAIHNLAHQKTIIMIAHRMSTVMECDVIYLMDKGRLVAEGTYDELIQSNLRFREMAN